MRGFVGVVSLLLAACGSREPEPAEPAKTTYRYVAVEEKAGDIVPTLRAQSWDRRWDCESWVRSWQEQHPGTQVRMRCMSRCEFISRNGGGTFEEKVRCAEPSTISPPRTRAPKPPARIQAGGRDAGP